ncbi:hypothetical protein L3C95_15010 [Chitinophaga filiformis]|uniref:hypothetical protein n=1 Tax=Chitinophaga filiformis TaxID=104663 RepID=UPI001F2DC85C|nr:hypothetical protein [Chitinophaga filiformis]MCF6404203.1 hypothetical protein [Chitinophaga filiformis]
MKEHVSHDNALYEQIALDYFLQHIFPGRDYFYNMVYYKPVIDPATSGFRLSAVGGELSAEAYQTDSSAENPDLSGQRLVVAVPPDVKITEEHEGIEDPHAMALYLTVYTRLPLMNGHCMVDVEIHGYRFFDRFFIEINRGDNKVVNWFVTGMRF